MPILAVLLWVWTMEDIGVKWILSCTPFFWLIHFLNLEIKQTMLTTVFSVNNVRLNQNGPHFEDIFKCIFLNKYFMFSSKFPNLFPRARLSLRHQCFKKWPAIKQAESHYLKQRLITNSYLKFRGSSSNFYWFWLQWDKTMIRLDHYHCNKNKTCLTGIILRTPKLVVLSQWRWHVELDKLPLMWCKLSSYFGIGVKWSCFSYEPWKWYAMIGLMDSNSG